jgi:transcription initiation factor IIE alpha subunit
MTLEVKLEKANKHCSNCETKYTIEWDIEEQDLEPLTCPFCGHEVSIDDVEEVEQRYETNEEDDSWN